MTPRQTKNPSNFFIDVTSHELSVILNQHSSVNTSDGRLQWMGCTKHKDIPEKVEDKREMVNL